MPIKEASSLAGFGADISGVGGIISGISSITDLFGGGGNSQPSSDFQAYSQIYSQTQQNKQNALDRKTYGDNLGGQQPFGQIDSNNTSIPLNGLAPPKPPPTWDEQLLEVGKGLAKDLFTTTAKGIVQNKVNQMMQPGPTQQQQILQNPAIRGAQHKQYMDAAFPGTNPWERLGSSASGGGSQGGLAVQQQAREASAHVAEQHRASSIDSAHIQTHPQIKRIDWATPSEVGKNIAGAHALESKAGYDISQTKGQNITNTWIQRLSSAKQGLEIQKGSLASAQYNTEVEKRLQTIQQVKTEVQRSAIAKHDKNIKHAIANLSALARENPTAAKWAGAAGALITALRGLGRLAPAAMTRGSKKK